MTLKIHEEIESEEDWLDSLAYEVVKRITHKRQLYLEEWMESHRLEHPEDDPGVRRRLGEVAAKRKAAELLPVAMSEIVTPHVASQSDAVYKRVVMLVDKMLPKPQKRAEKRKSKRKTKAQFRADMERASDSLLHGTKHGEFPIPGIRIRRIYPRAGNGNGKTARKIPYRKRRQKRVEPVANDSALIPVSVKELFAIARIEQAKNQSIESDFPGPVKKPAKTATFGFMAEVPKTDGRPRKNWRREVGI